MEKAGDNPDVEVITREVGDESDYESEFTDESEEDSERMKHLKTWFRHTISVRKLLIITAVMEVMVMGLTWCANSVKTDDFDSWRKIADVTGFGTFVLWSILWSLQWSLGKVNFVLKGKLVAWFVFTIVHFLLFFGLRDLARDVYLCISEEVCKKELNGASRESIGIPPEVKDEKKETEEKKRILSE